MGIELIAVSPLEKIVAALGGGLSILALIDISFWALPHSGAMPIVASMGASAVLLFAVPHGQLSQPWPVLAGHGFSALIGVLCAKLVPHPFVAAACACGLAIALMHQLKCIHPPGGATALTAVMGGPAVHDLGFDFVLVPVLANALVMVLLAMLINCFFKWRRYPAVLNQPRKAKPLAPSVAPPPPSHEEVLAAVKSLDSFVDITEKDLLRLIELLNRHPQRARSGPPTDISREQFGAPTQNRRGLDGFGD